LCGNGTIQSPEQCDDGNVLAGDGCSATCTVEPTGTQPCTATTPTVTGSAWQNGQMPYDVNKDGVVTSADLTALLNELRSRGPSWLTTPNTTSLMPDVNGSRSLTNLDLVLLNSYLRQCGLQQTTPTTTPATTAPAPTPTVAVCGDRVVQGREQCDDGNTLPGDGCSPTCTRTTACTDGVDNDNDGLIDNGSDPGCDGTSTDNDETNARAELSVVSNTVAVAEVRRVTATVRSTATEERARNNTKNTFRNDTRNTSTFI
jgi:cysteine-rich repeat protein